ncbi:MAG: hypothetical protein KJ052_20145 [Candidatus Hydrogenedentes bacterium]|nr:hypothetical protein [Candidatus Hydrogenedentota bacterium]
MPLALSALQRPVPSETPLRALDFTPAEIRLAQQIARGRTVAQAAADLGMSHHTARAHLRSIFTKTQVHELLRELRESPARKNIVQLD